MVHDKLHVNELMSRDLLCFPPVTKLSDVAHMLRSTTHGAFPVTQDAVIGVANKDPISLQGIVTRINVLRMIQRKIGFLYKVRFLC